MNESDKIRLQHMLEAATKALNYTSGKTRSDLGTNEMLVLSLVKLIEILGEAANKISSDCKRDNPTIPWSDIVAMRNRLIHAYFDINLDILWSTVTKELPALITEIMAILPPK